MAVNRHLSTVNYISYLSCTTSYPMQNELLHRIALTLVPHIGPVQARLLVDHFGDAASIFKAKRSALDKLDGIGTVRSGSIKQFDGMAEAEKELVFIDTYKINPLFLTDPQYPRRLLNCYDPPTLLYYRGNTDLNAKRILAVVGTRYKTDYGKHLAEKLVAELATHDTVVVSGLALGIDAIAHKTALKNGLPTVGVLAHGLDKIYPSEHKGLARDMLREQGGLLTEFRSKTSPDKHNFPTRNRIVAGMSDAAVVIETDIKGGSMITANLAFGYNREVFAFPGKTTDAKSAGCNYLIRSNKAMLVTSATDIAEAMGWEHQPAAPKPVQQVLFTQLPDDEKRIVDLLKEKEVVHIDELNAATGLGTSMVAAALLSLEMQNLVASLPGKRYRLN